ncbi:tetratricopeptide repeat protein [Tranquillimonas rosea]|nr:tetratricopeptide repeat protein [Tranquillimonas rosea]
MRPFRRYLKYAVAAFLLGAGGTPLPAQNADLDPLFQQLRSADDGEAEPIVQKIYEEWSNSGSASMDLLLERGREALQAGDTEIAIEHFSALIDHAPDFAEGYNARATAFFQQKRYGLSLNDLEMALARNPRHFGALSGLAIIMEELGHEDLALRAWREVVALHPQQDQADEAIARLEQLVEGSRL